ncbi:MAG: peptidylprolyl isomerase [Bacteroidota bacterium]
MIKAIFQSILFTLYITSGFSQTEDSIRAALKDINSIDQIEGLGQRVPNWNILIRPTPVEGFYSDSIISKTKIGEFCKASDINNSGTYIYKILDRKKEEHCKVQYIFFHGSNYTMKELDSIRAIILDKYSHGIDFNTLHKIYNEDGNKTGVLDWFCKGLMVKDFDSAVRKRKKNEIFIVDIPEIQWHYVVLKLEKNKMMNVTHTIGVELPQN